MLKYIPAIFSYPIARIQQSFRVHKMVQGNPKTRNHQALVTMYKIGTNLEIKKGDVVGNLSTSEAINYVGRSNYILSDLILVQGICLDFSRRLLKGRSNLISFLQISYL